MRAAEEAEVLDITGMVRVGYQRIVAREAKEVKAVLVEELTLAQVVQVAKEAVVVIMNLTEAVAIVVTLATMVVANNRVVVQMVLCLANQVNLVVAMVVEHQDTQPVMVQI